MSADEFKSQSVTVGDPQDLFNLLSRAIEKSYAASGCKAPDKSNETEVESYNDMLNYLVFYIRKRFVTMQFRDVKAAIQYGSVGEYGDFYGINTKSLVKFLTCFYNSEEHKREVKKRIILYQPMSEKPTPEEQFRVAKENLITEFEAHKRGESIPRLSVTNYDFLNSLGLITYDKATKEKIMQDATPAAISEATVKKAGEKDVFIRKGINDLISRFNLGPDKGTLEHGLIISKAKAITCLKYFDDVKLAGLDMAKVIEDKKALFLSLNK